MKKMMMLIAAMMLTASTISAQSSESNQQARPDRTEMIKSRTDRVVKQLGLNDTQAKQLLDLNTAFADKLPGMGGRGMARGGQRGGRNNDSQAPRERPSREQMEARMKEMQANMEAYNTELKKILTEEQYAKYQEAQKQRMQRRGQGGPRQNNNFGNIVNGNNNPSETE